MDIQKYPIHHRLTYHFVWGPMRFKPCLCGEAGSRLVELIEEKVEELGLALHDFRVMPDRVYLAVSAPPTMPAASRSASTVPGARRDGNGPCCWPSVTRSASTRRTVTG
jgi:REP element-mobilizing transposase RayT